MSRHFTVQCSYSSHHANTVTVEADTLEEALEKALEAANEDPDGWRSTDHVSDTVIDAVCEGADCDPWGEGALPVPDRFTERGEPPVVTLTDPGRPGAASKSPAAGSSSASQPKPARSPARLSIRRIRRATNRSSRCPSDPMANPWSRSRAARPEFAFWTADPVPAWRRPQSIHPERPSRAVRSRGRPCPVAGRPGRGSVPIFRARLFSNRRPRP